MALASPDEMAGQGRSVPGLGAALLTLACAAALGSGPEAAARDKPEPKARRLSIAAEFFSSLNAVNRLGVQQLPGVGPLFRSRRAPPPRGGGKPVLIVPGFMASDLMIKPMVRPLEDAGYRVYNAAIRFNAGSMKQKVAQLINVLEATKRRTGQRSALVGHSLGGVLSRTVAALRPDLVRGVVGVASPLGGNLDPSSAKPEAPKDDPVLVAMATLMIRDNSILNQPQPTVPVYSIRAAKDGLVDASKCKVPGGKRRNLTVPGGHLAAPFQQQTLDLLLYRILPRL